VDPFTKRRPWLRIDEAAKFLSETLKDRVTNGRILRTALDGGLNLCVFLPVPVFAHRWIVETEVASGSGSRIDGLWNLRLEGAGRVQVESLHNRAEGLTYIHVARPSGALVDRGGEVYQLPPDYGQSHGMSPRASSAFPQEALLVVKTEVLSDFASACAKDPIDRPFGQRERTTLLLIIAALAREAGIDIDAPGVGTRIEALTQEIGAPVERKTIEAHLARIPDAIERRGN
jgi:hypothetical protein